MDKKKNKSTNILNYIKIVFLVFITILSFIYTIKTLDKINLQVDDLFLLSLVDSSNNLEKEGLSSNIVNYVIELDFLNPINLLQNNYKGLVNKVDNSFEENLIPAIKDEGIVNKPSLEEVKPIVYIYNTHQGEEYASKSLSVHNIKPTVLLASYMLEEKLEKNGINTIVEESDVSEILRINNWNYASSYLVTKMLMEQAKEDNPSLIYFIDLHRDSVSYDKTTAVIDGKSYAKVLFLLGLENPNYKESEKVISRLNTIISNKYPGISKGIYKKGGSRVNGVYNQDFSSRCVLIEVGGVDNTIEEVSNTINAISDMLIVYIKEDYEQRY